jgi:hypothetical protein
MNTSLPPESDRYDEEERQARLVVLRRAISRGVDELDAGRGVDGEQAFAQILEELELED